MLLSVQPSELATKHGGPLLMCHSFNNRLENSFRELKTDAAEPLLEPTGVHQY
jgi:hypothetical protein